MPPNHIVVDLPDGALVVAPNGDGVYASFGSSIYNVTVTNGVGARIYAGDDGIEINTSAATATGAMIVDNSGIIVSTFSAATETGRAINIDLPLVAPGSVTIINHETGHLQGSLGEAIVITGDSDDTITNEGIIIGSVETGGGNDTFNLFTASAISGLIDGGTGIDIINLAGSGSGTLQNFAGIQIINVNDGAWTVELQTGPQTVRLANAVIADGSFDGAINNAQIGDTLNLAGIGLATSAILGPNNLLTISGGASASATVQLDPLQSFAGMAFQVSDDGAGGTNVLLVPTNTLNLTGSIVVLPTGIGVQLTIGASDPGASRTVINSGTINSGGDSLLVDAQPSVVAATGTFLVDNSGTMLSATGHAVNFDLPLTAPGSVTVINRATGVMEVASGDAIVISGDTNDTVINQGMIDGGISTGAGVDTLNLHTGSTITGLVNGGLGTDTINLNGTGQGTLQSFTGIEVINVNQGSWALGSEGAAVNFQNGSQTVRLANNVLMNGSFTGTISNFATGDLIGLAGIGLATSAILGANNVLTVNGGTGGTVTLQLDPAQDFSGMAFTLASDGAGGTNIALVPAGSGGGAVIGGTSGSDAVTSGSGNDVIVSGDGNDTVSAGGGNDFIVAGNGNSALSGDNGNDTIIAGDGNNNVNGGNGDDAVTVGSGNNSLATANGNDSVIAGNGDNNIASGNGNDHVTAGNGDNAVNTDNGNDSVVAGNGDNTINTGAGDDQLTVGNGVNALNAGNGNDAIVAGNGNNNINTGAGDDDVTAGDGDNTLNTDNGNDVVATGDGNNKLNAGNGNDTVTVGDGDNILNGGNGADSFHVGSGDNILTGNGGGDTFYFAADFGNNEITDFTRADTIVFAGVFGDFDALLDVTTQVGSDTVIALNAFQSITLADVSRDWLNASDFDFV